MWQHRLELGGYPAADCWTRDRSLAGSSRACLPRLVWRAPLGPDGVLAVLAVSAPGHTRRLGERGVADRLAGAVRVAVGEVRGGNEEIRVRSGRTPRGLVILYSALVAFNRATVSRNCVSPSGNPWKISGGASRLNFM